MSALPRWARRFLRDTARPQPVDLAWITPSVAVGAAPSARQIRQSRHLSLTAILDLRTPSEKADDPTWERTLGETGIRLINLPVRDFTAPTLVELEHGCSCALDELADDGRVLICCRAGIGRSVVFATALLVRLGYSLPEAFGLISHSRPVANPTDEQFAALKAFAGLAPERPSGDEPAR